MSTGSLASRLRHIYRYGGFAALWSGLSNHLQPAVLHHRQQILSAVERQSGLEIGGPSRVFQAGRLLPIYSFAARIDNVNFSVQTTWETNLRDGGEFHFDRRRAPGRQLIRNATALTGIADHAYDFVLSSHCLEHLANPLRALQEWHRVTRPGGHLMVILPDPARTFDHRRPITTFAHLQNDLSDDTDEDDATHIPEVLALHDLARDPWAGSAGAFEERVRHNSENRCLHHHVFNLPLLVAALKATGWQAIAQERARPVHLCVFARKP